MMYRRERRVIISAVVILAAMALAICAGTAYGWLLVQLGRAIL